MEETGRKRINSRATKRSLAWKSSNRSRYLLLRARRRAELGEIPFNISEEDIVIPKRCPLLGVKIDTRVGVGRLGCGPSLDRIVPALGYTRGNVMVISDRANRIKRDATLQELKDLVENLDKILTKRLHKWSKHK